MIKPKKKFEKKRSFKSKLVIFLFVLLGIGALSLFAVDLFVRSLTYSEGYRVGTIVKFSNKGVIFKTEEGQLHLGGVDADGEGGFSPFWDFSVYGSAEAVQTAIDEASEQKKRVKLYYKEKYFTLPWRGDTKHFVYKVEPAE